MSIVSTSINRGNVKPNYPCLLISTSGLVVLFTEEQIGTVIQANDNTRIGEYRTNWGMEKFTYFVDEINLRNAP